MKAGIYARVSTHDQHTFSMQIETMKNMLRHVNSKLKSKLQIDEVITLFKSGLSQSEIARKLNIGRTSVRRILHQSIDNN